MFEFTFYIYESAKNNFLDHIGTISVILLFIIERILNNRIKKNESKRQWYLTVIVEPNLELIKNFFKNYKIVTYQSFDYLDSVDKTKNESYLNVKSKIFDRIKSLRREITDNFLIQVCSFDEDVYVKLSEIIQNLEDWVTTKIDAEEIDVKILKEEFEHEYHFIYNEFMSSLNEPID